MIRNRESLHKERVAIKEAKARVSDHGKKVFKADQKTWYFIDTKKHNPLERIAQNVAITAKYRNNHFIND